MYARVKEKQKCHLKDYKALSKQEVSNVCKDACYLNPFFLNLNQLPVAKKDFKNEHPNKCLALLVLSGL